MWYSFEARKILCTCIHCFTDEISRLKPKLLFSNNTMVNYYVFGTKFTDISIYLFSSFKMGLTAAHNHYSKYSRYNNLKIVFSQQSNAHGERFAGVFFHKTTSRQEKICIKFLIRTLQAFLCQYFK